MSKVNLEVCLDCISEKRGRTGETPGDTEVTTAASIQAKGDSGSGWAGGSQFGFVPPREVPVRGNE